MGRMNPKGCPSPGPQPSAAGGGAKKKTNHEIGMEKMLHIGGGKKIQPRTLKKKKKKKTHRFLHKAIVVNCHF